MNVDCSILYRSRTTIADLMEDDEAFIEAPFFTLNSQ